MMHQWPNFLNFLAYLAVALPMLGLGMTLFMATTPYKENPILAEGDEFDDKGKFYAAQAVAYDIGGKMVGMSLVMASAVYHAVNLVDLAIWGALGAVFQILVFYLYEWVSPFKVTKEIPRGNVAVGILSAFISVATGLLMASLISY